jgi:hypothetical protein
MLFEHRDTSTCPGSPKEKPRLPERINWASVSSDNYRGLVGELLRSNEAIIDYLKAREDETA